MRSDRSQREKYDLYFYNFLTKVIYFIGIFDNYYTLHHLLHKGALCLCGCIQCREGFEIDSIFIVYIDQFRANF